jgi:hypothetical protein
MLQIFGARLFETEHLATLRIDPGHDVPDGPILAGRVHCLEDQQDRIAIRRVVQALQFAQLLDVRFEEFVVLLLRCANCLHKCWPLFKFDLGAGLNLEIF